MASRNRRSSALRCDPFDRCADRCRERSRDGDHCRVQINSYDTSSRTDPFRRGASDDAGPASNVQHALADADVSDIDKQGRPGSEDVPSDVALVPFGRLRAQLPLPVLGHLPFHPSLRDMRSAVCVTALIWA